MVHEPPFWMITVLAALVGGVVAIHAALAGWRGWLEVRRHEIDVARGASAPTPATRIEMADLKERIRKLEAIAAGVEF